MPPSLSLTRGLALAVALVTAVPIASAAPAKHGKKPKHAAPAAAPANDTPSTADATDKPSAKPEDATPPRVEDKPPLAPAPPASTAANRSSGVALATDVTDVKEAKDVSPDADQHDQYGDYEALGRREAKRLAAGRSEVSVSVSMDVGNRRFKYSDALGSALRPYQLPIAPMASFGLEAYPLAATDVPVLRDLGFRGRFSRAFGLDSTTPDGAQIETSWTRFGGDMRARLLIPGRHPLEFGAFFGADASYFVMSSQATVMALLPSARTISLRFGLDGRVLVLGRFSTLLSLAYLAVISPGEIYDHFRDPHVAGIDGELGCAVALIPGLEARLSGRYTRYFATFHPQVGDPYVAGGALDEQLQIALGVRYAH